MIRKKYDVVCTVRLAVAVRTYLVISTMIDTSTNDFIVCDRM
jgi:hypothetical protein